MSSAVRRQRSFVLAVLAAAAIAGCSHTMEVDATLGQSPVVEVLPLTMGVHYPPELRRHHSSTSYGIHTFDYYLGSPSIALFDQVFSGMFARVISMTEDPIRFDDDVGVAAIIVMRLERFQPYDFSFGAHSTIIHTPVKITYRAILYSPQGNQIDSWTVDGSGVYETESGPGQVPGPEALTAIAMRRAAGKFIAGFHQQPEVAKWLTELLAPTSPRTSGASGVEHVR